MLLFWKLNVISKKMKKRSQLHLVFKASYLKAELIFTEPKSALCGNGVVEEGEECDCGWEEDCEESCCWPQKNKPKKGEKPCTLRPKKVCSPTQVCLLSNLIKYI